MLKFVPISLVIEILKQICSERIGIVEFDNGVAPNPEHMHLLQRILAFCKFHQGDIRNFTTEIKDFHWNVPVQIPNGEALVFAQNKKVSLERSIPKPETLHLLNSRLIETIQIIILLFVLPIILFHILDLPVLEPAEHLTAIQKMPGGNSIPYHIDRIARDQRVISTESNLAFPTKTYQTPRLDIMLHDQNLLNNPNLPKQYNLRRLPINLKQINIVPRINRHTELIPSPTPYIKFLQILSL